MDSARQPFGFIQREAALLLVFAIAAIPLFLFTRKVAAWDRRTHLQAAAHWFAEGNRQMAARQIPAAIDSFHTAAVNDRDNRQYGLALATALASAGRDGEARQALLRWREASPEDPEINLQLARLAAKQGNSQDSFNDALRYYHNAIFGVWADNVPPEKRIDLRFELAEWLLKRGQHGPAVAELIALKSELPDGPQYAIRSARLFLAAGDAARALQGFQRAIDHARVDHAGDNPVALAGAGEASFDLGQYERAHSYLDQALRDDPNMQPAARLREIAGLVLESDPLAMRLGEEDRRQRTIAGLDQAVARLESCPAAKAASGVLDLRLLEELRGRVAALRKRGLASPAGTAQTATDVESIVRAEKAAAALCGAPTGLDQALLLAARRHGISE